MTPYCFKPLRQSALLQKKCQKEVVPINLRHTRIHSFQPRCVLECLNFEFYSMSNTEEECEVNHYLISTCSVSSFSSDDEYIVV